MTTPRLAELYRQRDHAEALLTYLDAQIADEKVTAAAEAGDEGRRLLLTICDLYGVTPSVVLGDSRLPSAVRARRAACWLLRTSGLSYPVAGKLLELDHTTVMHHWRAVEADPRVRALLAPLLTTGYSARVS